MATITGGSSIQLDVSTSRIAIGTHTVLLKVTARVDHLTIVDVVTVTVIVNRQISAQKNVVLILSDGTLQSSIIDNVRVRTGFQDMSYTLGVVSKGAEFGIRHDGMIYCSRTVNVTALASDNHVAVERWLNVTASKDGITKDLADYRILIIRNTYSTSLDENQASVIAQFDLVSDSFEFSAHDLPNPRFTRASNHISVSKLDYESKKQYHFSLDVKIKGDNSAATKIPVSVAVNDLNDERPAFSQQKFHFTLLSNTVGNTLIGIVTASDVDTVGRLYYQIRSGSTPEDYFNVDEETGVLASSRTLSSNEVGTSVTLAVDVCDDTLSNKPRCANATVVITLISISINARNLNNSFVVTVKENLPAGTHVQDISAANYTGYVSHDMISSGLFSLDRSTGVITTQKKLDWETIPRIYRRSVYFIQATKEGEDQCFLDNFGSLVITVEDVNDNRPTFNHSLYSGTVEENSHTGAQIYFNLIDTTHTPGDFFYQLYMSSTIKDFSKIVWHDPDLQGFECNTAYRWHITHRPSTGYMRLIIKHKNAVMVDSGPVYDSSILGGRLGVFAFDQIAVIWSNLRYECKTSFTLEALVKLPSGYGSARYPIICTNGSSLCMFIEDGVLKGQIPGHLAEGTTTLTSSKWIHVGMRYNAQGQEDADGDSVGDACDNCPVVANPTQSDTNRNGIGDLCESADKDGDSIPDNVDNCPEIPNAEQKDTDADGKGDECDNDSDDDGIPDTKDNCPLVKNPSQDDVDGNHRGDLCELDLDMDGTIDRLDNCPENKFISRTSFVKHTAVDFIPTWMTEPAAIWRVLDNGMEIRQDGKTRKAVALIGDQHLDHMDFYGTTFVEEDDCDGFVGFIFGYQSTSKFYLVLWRHKHHNFNFYGGIKGPHIKLIDTAHTPGDFFYLLYMSSTIKDFSKIVWQDPDLQGFECNTAYRWHIIHRPSTGYMRLIIKHDNTVMVDSGPVYDSSILGGRLGVFAFDQIAVIWSNLRYECKTRQNYALKMDGVDDYAEIGMLHQLGIEESFTLEALVKLPSGYGSARYPIICTNGSSICMFIEDGVLKGQIPGHLAEGTTTLTSSKWIHVGMRYNAQERKLALILEKTTSGLIEETHILNENETLYIGYDGTNFFKGEVDEIGRNNGLQIGMNDWQAWAQETCVLYCGKRRFHDGQVTLPRIKYIEDIILAWTRGSGPVLITLKV
ncbi:uncharacterized protein LOC121381567 [Gigantopelta aegis]|uniref:uncharacterized protein LOC121381567 n=1 Tax=Gigantopelta aegis TaxID=1735272 RepID=UPI001B88DAA0|nr:uncharacterized protein LOC121381567 [Gigantopelta aegis]